MPRPKGSKNKAKTVKAKLDYAAMIAEKQNKKDTLAEEIAAAAANLDAVKAELKAKKAAFKKLEKEQAKLETKKAAAETKAAEAAKKSEAENMVKKLLASGMSADDILAKLQ